MIITKEEFLKAAAEYGKGKNTDQYCSFLDGMHKMTEIMNGKHQSENLKNEKA